MGYNRGWEAFSMPKYCVLEDDKLCTECGRCNYCDLDPEKICDNCMRCVRRSDADFAQIEIDAVYATQEEPPQEEE